MSSASRCWFQPVCPRASVRRSSRCSRREPFQPSKPRSRSLCLPFTVIAPRPAATAIYERLFALYRKAYFALGTRSAQAVPLGEILPELRKIAEEVAKQA